MNIENIENISVFEEGRFVMGGGGDCLLYWEIKSYSILWEGCPLFGFNPLYHHTLPSRRGLPPYHKIEWLFISTNNPTSARQSIIKNKSKNSQNSIRFDSISYWLLDSYSLLYVCILYILENSFVVSLQILNNDCWTWRTTQSGRTVASRV